MTVVYEPPSEGSLAPAGGDAHLSPETRLGGLL
jgi:hypothetical protein